MHRPTDGGPDHGTDASAALAAVDRLPRVVVLGGGIAGLAAVERLAGAPVEVVLVDRNPHHTFRPLLYQVALGGLTTDGVAPALSDLVPRGTRVVVDRVTGLDLDHRRVELADGEDLSYDWLVVALGAAVDHFGVPGAAEHSVGVAELRDAERLGGAVADLPDGAQVVVVGGGPTGVEVAGALADRAGRDGLDLRVELVEVSDEVLPSYRETSRRHGLDALADRDVVVRLGDPVVEVGPRAVRLGSGTVRPADLVVWGTGITAKPIATSLGLPVGDGGRVPVDETLRLPGSDDVFVLGDLAGDVSGGRGLAPQLASVAQQHGTHAGGEIARAVAGGRRRRFRYVDRGTLAVVGDGSAVADLPGGLTLTGLPAWLLWYGVHLAVLPGIPAKVAVARDWVVEGARRLPLVGRPLAGGLLGAASGAPSDLGCGDRADRGRELRRAG